MPVFRILAFEGLILDLLFQLMEESILSSHTEVAHSQEAHLFENELPWKFKLDSCVTQKVLKSQRRDLHDVSDVQAIDPLALVKVTKDVLHVRWATVISILSKALRLEEARCLARFKVRAWWSHISSSWWWDTASATLGELDWTCDVYATLSVASIVFNGHPFLNFDHDREKLNRCLL